MAFPVTAVLDNFNRADTGPPPSASWTTGSGTGHKVASNLCVINDVAGCASNWNTSQNVNQEAYATVAAVPSVGDGFGLLARVQNAAATFGSDHIYLSVVPVTGAGNDTLQVFKYISSVYTQLGADVALGADITVNDVFGMRLMRSEIQVYYGGTLRATRTDSDLLSGGYPGVDNGGATGSWDNFGGGSVAAHAVGGDVTSGHLVGGVLAR